ncbi:ChaN family lipoprotein [Polluticaenibacter yanchengensis]|uniref:ChaN family lipoprotein n=1 Tax=Polluticaenibacter yanchengensis TaxID=3014562 RepID=A0ABT4UGU1_9BACT|nr:ChaN family lipoprotein [Chitinophagaceae bacterium LY-5]
MKRYFLALFFLAGTGLSAFTQTPAETSYEIYNTKTGNKINWNELVSNLDSANIILWGEEHNDSIGHLLQLDMLKALHQNSKGKFAFSMEMFETDVQPIMNEYLAGWISEKNFKKESRSWNNYKDYEGMVNYAKAAHIPVICANSPARYTNMVTRGTLKALDSLPKATKKAYLPPLPIDTLTGRYSEKFLEILGGHMVPNMHLYQSQNLWDATMSYNILKASKKHRVFHINGRFHTDEYEGTAARVLRKTRQTVRTISCFNEEKYDEKAHQKLADFVIITKK